jgi:hypothetical protein
LTGIFCGLGIALLLIFRRNKRKATASFTWPETQGTVIKSTIDIGHDALGSDDSQGESQPMYSASVNYTYQVGDILYTSDRISFAGKSSYSKPDKAEALISKYPEGINNAVFYNPQKHEESVLERTSKGSGVFLIAGIAFFIIGLIALVIGSILLI